MEESLVVIRFLLPSNKNSPKAIHPGVEPLNDPASGAAAMQTLRGLFVATRLDVWRVASSAGFTADDVRVEPLVAAKMLRAARSWARTTKRNAVERREEKFLIVAICAVNRQAQRHATTVGQHRSLDARLAPIRRVWPGFFPRPREPWWSRRPGFATSIGCRACALYRRSRYFHSL